MVQACGSALRLCGVHIKDDELDVAEKRVGYEAI